MKIELSASADNQDSGALIRIYESLKRSGLSDSACRSAVNQMLNDGVTFKERLDEVDIPSDGSRMFIDQGTEYHTDETMAKVYRALHDSDLSSENAIDAITKMQNAGILFRERLQ